MNHVKVQSNNTLKAVIPAAGFGSRMLPITMSVPKEMLPVARKPAIQHLVEEAVQSGVREICIVIREGKEIIRDYFTLRQPEARRKQGERTVEELEALIASCELTFLYQQEPRGIGDALLLAKEFVGDEPFLMMVPDQLMLAREPATAQLLRRWHDRATVWSSLIRLPKEETPFFESSRGFEIERGESQDVVRIRRILSAEETRATYLDLSYQVRGFGRTVYPPEIFEYLGDDFVNRQTGEVDLLKTFEGFTGRLTHNAVLLDGLPMDIGTFEGYYRYLPRAWESSA